MPPVDNATLYVLILTITNTLAIGGAAGLLLFPGLFAQVPKADGAASVLDLQPGGTAPLENTGPPSISWGATSATMLTPRPPR